MAEIRKNDLVITSRSRYGKVIRVEVIDGIEKCLVRIGYKEHWIDESQLFKAQDAVRFKVTYEFNYNSKHIIDSVEVPIKKNTILFNSDQSVSLIELVKEKIQKQINQNVKILKIIIS